MANKTKKRCQNYLLAFVGRKAVQVSWSSGCFIERMRGLRSACRRMLIGGRMASRTRKRGRDPFFLTIAIGTALAGRPSHGSVRAELPHTALTLDSNGARKR